MAGGRELNAEEMIKLDLHIHNKTSGDWRSTLLESIDHRERLEAEARRHEAESGTCIRPICVIQVERTGLTPLRHRRFVRAEAAVEHFGAAAPMDYESLRHDLDQVADQDLAILA